MKKYLSILFVAIFTFALTGCGEKVTKCSGKMYYYGEAEVKIYSKGDDVKKIVTKNSQDFDSEEDAKEAIKAAEAEKEEGIKYSRDGKTVTITITEKKTKDKEDLSKKEAIEMMEAAGLTCK